MKRVTTWLALAGACALLPQSLNAANALFADQFLFPGQMLTQGCFFRLFMQGDGNLVTYGNGPVWASNTAWYGAYARMLPNGNFAIYNWDEQIVWQTNTIAPSYNPSCTEPVWSNNGGMCPMPPPPIFPAVRQYDNGNLVVSYGYGTQWASGVDEPWTTASCEGIRTSTTTVNFNTQRNGTPYASWATWDRRWSQCANACVQDSNCGAFSFYPRGAISAGRCSLYSVDPSPVWTSLNGRVSGTVFR